jgi:hypothetical protein
MRHRDPNFCQSSPLIFTFSSNYSICTWCLPITVICFCCVFTWKGIWAIHHFVQDSHGVIRFLRFHWDCKIFYIKFHPAVSWKNRNPILRSQWDHGFQSSGLNQTVETDPAVSLQAQKPNLQVSILQNGCSLYDQSLGRIILWKKEGQQSRDTLPLNILIIEKFCLDSLLGSSFLSRIKKSKKFSSDRKRLRWKHQYNVWWRWFFKNCWKEV